MRVNTTVTHRALWCETKCSVILPRAHSDHVFILKISDTYQPQSNYHTLSSLYNKFIGYVVIRISRVPEVPQVGIFSDGSNCGS